MAFGIKKKMRLKNAENIRNSRLKSIFTVSYKVKRVYMKKYLTTLIFASLRVGNEYAFTQIVINTLS